MILVRLNVNGRTVGAEKSASIGLVSTSSWGQLAESYGAELVGVDSMNQSVELLLTERAR